MERRLDFEVLEELGYEIEEKEGKFLFMDTISRYLYKNGESVTKLYIPNSYIYKGDKYTITSIGYGTPCFERFSNSDKIKLVIVPENLYKEIRQWNSNKTSPIGYDIIGIDENDRIIFFDGLVYDEGKAYVNSNGDIKGCTYFRHGNFCASISNEGVKVLSENGWTLKTHAARIN